MNKLIMEKIYENTIEIWVVLLLNITIYLLDITIYLLDITIYLLDMIMKRLQLP